jgi:hypothetical protein
VSHLSKTFSNECRWTEGIRKIIVAVAHSVIHMLAFPLLIISFSPWARQALRKYCWIIPNSKNAHFWKIAPWAYIIITAKYLLHNCILWIFGFRIIHILMMPATIGKCNNVYVVSPITASPLTSSPTAKRLKKQGDQMRLGKNRPKCSLAHFWQN